MNLRYAAQTATEVCDDPSPVQVRKVRLENIAKKKELNEVKKDVKGEKSGGKQNMEKVQNREGNSPQSCVQVVARPAAAARARVR